MDSITFFGSVEISLIVRASIFAFLFTLAGVAALKTNTQNRPLVNVLGYSSILLGIFNIWMAWEWLHLFYL